MASNQRTRAASESLAFLAISAAILVGLNVIFAIMPPLRLDWTADKIYTLSDGTKRLSRSLTDRLEVTAYFSEDLPPPFNATERYVRDILAEYESAAQGNMIVTFISPDTEDEKEQAQEDGVQLVRHEAIRPDGAQVVEGYRGLVMRYLDRTEVIPVIQDTSGLEYAITMALKKLVGERRTIGVIGGHEGPSLEEGLTAIRTCAPLYDFQEVDANSELDEEMAAVLVIGPKNAISEGELQNIDSFVMGGGALGVFGGGFTLDLETQAPVAQTVDSGINTLLRPYGVVMSNGIVLDRQCLVVPMRDPRGGIRRSAQPPIIIVGFDEAQREHPVAYRLEDTWAPFSSPLELTEGAENATIVARSSEESWVETGDSINLAGGWQPRTEGPFPLMAAVEGTLNSAFEEGATSSVETRVLVSGSSFMIRDEILSQIAREGQCPMIGSVAVALNSLDWLAQDSDLIAVRAKQVSDPPIRVPENVEAAEDEALEATRDAVEALTEGDQASLDTAVEERNAAVERAKAAKEEWDVKQAQYRWGNIFGAPILFALFGLIRWRMRLARRKTLKL